MSLVNKLCEKELLEYFEKEKIFMLHIILEAKEETIIHRIENDPIRDKSVQKEQKSNVTWQTRYLKTSYPDAVRIDTENKTLNEIIHEIIAMMENNSILSYE